MGESKYKPLYYKVKEDIKDKILNGQYNAGDFLPTESGLCEEYKVSRVTIRRAIDELIGENILERVFGMTAKVKGVPIPRSLNHLSGLYEEMTKAGIKMSSFILSSEKTRVNEALSEKLGLPADDEVHEIERLRYANGDPLCYQKIYIPVALCAEIDIDKLAKGSLYEIIEKDYGYKISNAYQTISACMSSYKIAALLELKDVTCMLKVSRITYLDTGECIEYSENYYVSERYELSMTLNR